MGVKIKDAQLVEQVTGNEKIPVSDGSGLPGAVTTEQIKEFIGKGDDNVQSDWNESDPTSDAFIKNKPAIPSEVTEETVAGWGFTKNTGDYSKPSSGIPKSDLASSVQTSLNKADTALQSEQYKGTVTSVKINGTTKTPDTNGMVDLGTIEGGGVTEEYVNNAISSAITTTLNAAV